MLIAYCAPATPEAGGGGQGLSLVLGGAPSPPGPGEGALWKADYSGSELIAYSSWGRGEWGSADHSSRESYKPGSLPSGLAQSKCVSQVSVALLSSSPSPSLRTHTRTSEKSFVQGNIHSVQKRTHGTCETAWRISPKGYLGNSISIKKKSFGGPASPPGGPCLLTPSTVASLSCCGALHEWAHTGPSLSSLADFTQRCVCAILPDCSVVVIYSHNSRAFHCAHDHTAFCCRGTLGFGLFQLGAVTKVLLKTELSFHNQDPRPVCGGGGGGGRVHNIKFAILTILKSINLVALVTLLYNHHHYFQMFSSSQTQNVTCSAVTLRVPAPSPGSLYSALCGCDCACSRCLAQWESHNVCPL